MRFLRYVLLTSLSIVLVTVALANRSAVTLYLLPEELAGFIGLPNALELPLFIVIFGGIVVGLLIGFVWEWFREHKQRAEAAQMRNNVKMLKLEVTRLKDEAGKEEDDVLALLETGTRTR